MAVRDDDFDRIMEGLEDAVAFVRGDADPAAYRVHVPATVDVKALRKRLKLTQEAFALRFGFTAAAVRDWEQGRKPPERTARAFLTVIDREPEAVERALGPAQRVLEEVSIMPDGLSGAPPVRGPREGKPSAPPQPPSYPRD